MLSSGSPRARQECRGPHSSLTLPREEGLGLTFPARVRKGTLMGVLGSLPILDPIGMVREWGPNQTPAPGQFHSGHLAENVGEGLPEESLRRYPGKAAAGTAPSPR